jgi:UDP-N-acetylglucosamine 2-epimerase (non-hydrolysing)
MPEEINRLVTDRLADLLLTPSQDASEQLRREGEPEHEIAFVGNVMIDTLYYSLEAARRTGFRRSLALEDGAVAVTLHRPSNVDDPQRMRSIAAALREIAQQRPVVFPVHPRTAQRMRDESINFGDVRLMEPLRYLDMLDLVDGAFAVVTDSGGLQEETTALGVPCFTVRPNTERPITITEGTNQLVPDPARLPELVRGASRNGTPRRPDGWDGHAAERIIEALVQRSG